MRVLIYSLWILLSFGAFADQCPQGETWVSGHPRKEYFRSDGVYVSAAQVTGHCRSKAAAYQFWSARLVNNEIKGWPHKSEKFKSWSRSEIEAAIGALDRVPNSLWDEIKIHRAKQSRSSGNPATSAEGEMVLYDEAFSRQRNLARIFVHELAHNRFKKMSALDRVAYEQVAQWQLVRGKSGHSEYKVGNRKFVASDGDLSPEEDFANNVEYFLFEPERLKLKTPPIYQWLQLEYGRIIN